MVQQDVGMTTHNCMIAHTNPVRAYLGTVMAKEGIVLACHLMAQQGAVMTKWGTVVRNMALR